MFVFNATLAKKEDSPSFGKLKNEKRLYCWFCLEAKMVKEASFVSQAEGGNISFD